VQRVVLFDMTLPHTQLHVDTAVSIESFQQPLTGAAGHGHLTHGRVRVRRVVLRDQANHQTAHGAAGHAYKRVHGGRRHLPTHAIMPTQGVQEGDQSYIERCSSASVRHCARCACGTHTRGSKFTAIAPAQAAKHAVRGALYANSEHASRQQQG
jgi:hypothetical protein